MKERKSTLASGWRKQTTLMISSNGDVGLLKINAHIVQMYFLT
jgi:hypothetical protein